MDTIKIYTPEEVAELLQVTPRSVYSYLRAGQLPGRKIGGKWRILEEELRAYLRGSDNISTES